MTIAGRKRRVRPTNGDGERRQPVWRQALVYLMLVALSLLFVYPFFWMVTTSLKLKQNIFMDPPQVLPNPVAWHNYVELFENELILIWLRNTVFITFVDVVAGTLASLIVAYGFARFVFPGSRVLFMLLLSTLMLPGHVTIIPMFIMFRNWGWLDSFWPFIVPPFFGAAFSIFLIRQFMMTLPRELDEAAEIDGASTWQILWRILAPLCKPAIATIAVFSFIGSWNEFFRPFIFLVRPEMLTLAVGIQWYRTRYGTEVHLLMAMSVLMVLPIIIAFFLAQKQFIRGIALTGLKG